MTDEAQTSPTNGARKWAPIIAGLLGVGAVGGGSSWLGNIMGGKAVEETRKHCDASQAALVKILDLKFAELQKDVSSVVADQKEALKAFSGVTSTLTLTVERLGDLKGRVDNLASSAKPK